MGKKQFTAVIEEGRGGGAWVAIPFNVETEYGTKGQVKVKASFDGHPYRGSIAPMGSGTHVLGVRKAVRESTGKSIGDTVTVVIERDTEEGTVDTPAPLTAAFENTPQAKTAFERLSYTPRKEFAQWIAGAKRDDTRARRVRKAIDMLLKGETL